MSGRATGDFGEHLALRYYQQRGYTRLAANFRCRMGEVDLIVQAPDGTLVFAEVKTRNQGAPGLPRDAVTPAKQRRLVLAAKHYLALNGLSDPFLRFDVVEVILDGKNHSINCIENAF